MKILINKCYGGFSFSEEFEKHLKTKYNFNEEEDEYSENLTDNMLAEEAEQFGLDKASGSCAKLVIEEIPDFAQYRKGEYDGQEWIEETWIEVSEDELFKGLSLEKISQANAVSCIKIKY